MERGVVERGRPPAMRENASLECVGVHDFYLREAVARDQSALRLTDPGGGSPPDKRQKTICFILQLEQITFLPKEESIQILKPLPMVTYY